MHGAGDEEPTSQHISGEACHWEPDWIDQAGNKLEPQDAAAGARFLPNWHATET